MWLDIAQEDSIMGVKSWKKNAMVKGEWKKICEAAKILQEL
jgi:hypothetical protein